MSAFLSPIGNGQQFFTDTGLVNSGGLIYTYIAGTTILTSTWSTSGQSVVNANPIVLNAYGRLSQEIWFQSGLQYKFVITNSAGVQLNPGTYDTLSGINDVAAAAPSTEWVLGSTPTYISPTSFSVTGNQTNVYNIGRRIQAQVLSGTVYGTIQSSVFTTITTVSLVMDLPISGPLDTGISIIAFGIVSGTPSSAPVPVNQTIPYASTINWNGLQGIAAKVTLTGNPIIAKPSNLFVGTYVLILAQDSVTGNRTVTWDAAFKWPSGVKPILSTAVNSIDLFSFFSDGINMYGSYIRGVA
jgi:hypothetical protein